MGAGGRYGSKGSGLRRPAAGPEPGGHGLAAAQW